MNSDKIILDLCGGTGTWSKPYKQAGYDVRIITLPYYDVRTYKPPKNVYGVLAAPPCTHFSIAGAQYWDEKDRTGETQAALDIVYACFRIAEECQPKFFALENPKGRLTRYIGRPIYKFNFSDFGGKCVKPTYLWGDFNTMIIKGPFTPEAEIKRFDELSMSELPQLPDGYNLDIDHCKRAAQRSIYPEAFCQAFYEANR